ncbi:MAG: class II aldolase/adducin family protein [Candidatus Obscuribacterales bacterium]
MTYDFTELVELSRLAGERFDLVQAGGGNTSVKLDDGRLYVKASGMALSDVSKDDFCCVQWKPLLQFLDNADGNCNRAELEAQSKEIVKNACQPGPKRPSIETMLHCTLGRLTLHTHPIAVATAVCRSDWRSDLEKLFPDAFFVDYKTPGPALALALRQQLQQRHWQPGGEALIFLKNHGMIVAGNTLDTVMTLTNDVVERIGQTDPYDLSKYKAVNALSRLVNETCGTEWLAYLSDDQVLNQSIESNTSALLSSCATPDQLVYCGPEGLRLDSEDPVLARTSIKQFLKTKKHAPKVILMPAGGKERIFLLGKSLRKCKEMEDVLKSHVILQTSGNPATMQFLPREEVDYLSNWEAEKYRQNL